MLYRIVMYDVHTFSYLFSLPFFLIAALRQPWVQSSLRDCNSCQQTSVTPAHSVLMPEYFDSVTIGGYIQMRSGYCAVSHLGLILCLCLNVSLFFVFLPHMQRSSHCWTSEELVPRTPRSQRLTPHGPTLSKVLQRVL